MGKPFVGSIARFRLDIKRLTKSSLKVNIAVAKDFAKRFGSTGSSKKTLKALQVELRKRR